MLEALRPQAPDKIIALMGELAADPRPGKVDLGVGVYKDAQGRTPVMRAVKAAEARLLAEQTSKSYKPLLGDPGFIAAMQDLVLGGAVPADRLSGSQTPGGTGAVSILYQLALAASPEGTLWVSNPSWPNHAAIARHLKMRLREYRYFDDRTRGVDFAAMRDDLKAAGPRDTVILHGCCHNPTGANLSREEWAELTAMALAQGFLPLVDFAYQGFGDGLAADAEGVRAMAAEVPEMLLAASCSKNFGVYRDRVGSAIVVSRSTKERDVARENLSALNRLNYSFAPDHGAAVVTTILTDPILRADWEAELESMRVRMLALRKGLAEAMRRETNDSRFDFVAGHRGMFSRLGATPEQVARLKAEDAIYLVGDGRINVAGLPEGGLDALARALVRVGM